MKGIAKEIVVRPTRIAELEKVVTSQAGVIGELWGMLDAEEGALPTGAVAPVQAACWGLLRLHGEQRFS